MIQKPTGKYFIQCYIKIKMHQAYVICQLSLARRRLLAWQALCLLVSTGSLSQLWSVVLKPMTLSILNEWDVSRHLD